MRKTQAEIVKQLSHRELMLNVYFSQLLFLGLAIVFAIFMFQDISDLFQLFKWNPREILLFGLVPGLLVVLIDILLIRWLPEKAYDDGGINQKVFENASITGIFLIALVVSVSEELLFRGVIQTNFGYIFASLIFALIHFRYLKKIVLLVSVLLLSFLIGYMYVLTENLLVTITAHFTIDFLLGIYYRLRRSDINGTEKTTTS
ncbi:CPBP family intramembrane glutamic endopeptidase [Aquisalibacillus elongatus]|uniref:CAAX prenyl protease 2/Lysostaphin resistance protein A-like domain-containing protein n=1 Tax=Aquisalibacillus elongatus TaxID=485577 RepID=A0A3N5CAP7_9BACI|nr:CPBP family intramembrane glutamic endopeptidase [Aquisalibacillus elongatus]RPF55745.1 hypothetical protein EDC24_0629 [Aquisalibacillus elongatus]